MAGVNSTPLHEPVAGDPPEHGPSPRGRVLFHLLSSAGQAEGANRSR
jgi:hypothetical protein